MRSVSVLNRAVSKYLSKSVHFLTAFVYLFTFLGPSLALATSTITYTETVQEEQVVAPQTALPTPTVNTVFAGTGRTVGEPSSARQDEYRRFNLKISPLRGGIRFHLQDFEGNHSLAGYVRPDDFRDSPFKALMTGDLHTGFTVDVPDVGQIQCDWQGNLKLVGLHTTNPETPALALTLVTNGTVECSDVTFKNLSIKAKQATFLKDIKIQEESVFDIKVLDLASSDFENTKLMTFLSKTRFVSQDIWRNRGEIIGEGSLFFDSFTFCNFGTVHSTGHLKFFGAQSDCFLNSGGVFHGDRGTTVSVSPYYFSNYAGGKISSGGLTRLYIGEVGRGSLGNISGQNVILEDRSGAEHFTLKDGTVTAQERVTLVGNSPEMPNVRFVTPQLVLDADGFDLGEQNAVERTLIMRSKDQDFTLTKDYKTDGTLEIWQRDLTTRDAVQEAMDERFGDETGVMPEHESLIDLQASIKAAGGLAFFTPHAKVRLGDAAKEDLREFTSQNGWLEAYATLFDLEKGTLVAENAHVHAPGGILTGRLDKD